MSARKPLARMDSPATTAAVDDKGTKQEPIENGSKPNTTETQSQIKIKEEKPDPDETGSSETPTPLFSDGKRVTRNSPMLLASPLKKKVSESQEQDSSAESTSTVDESSKKEKEKPPTARSRKQSDTNSKSAVPAPTNRMTRNAVAKDLADNTRLTRARRTSTGAGRSETQPKRRAIARRNVEPIAPAVKRKRSTSPKSSADEPVAKIIKADVDFDINAVIIKQELLESSEEMASDVASDITEPFLAELSTRISLRSRKAMSYSPSRPYRKVDKASADASKAEGKRKRLSRVRTDEDSKDSLASSTIDDVVDIKREEKFPSEDTNEAILTPSAATDEMTCTPPSVSEEITATPPEDTNEVILTPSSATDKMTCTPPSVSEDISATHPLTGDKETSTPEPATDAIANGPTESQEQDKSTCKSAPAKEIAVSIDTPLTVDTTEPIDVLKVNTDEVEVEADTEAHMPSTSAASVSDHSSVKSASLSPELVSEGVSEICVKQFYKKPEFMENNLGIEKDPKLGEIVQNVAEKMDDATDRTSVSNESIKEGELQYEDDDEVSSIGEIKSNNYNDDDDANSVSTGFISPLVVEEDEEDEEEMQSALSGGDEKIEESSIPDESRDDCPIEEIPVVLPVKDVEEVEVIDKVIEIFKAEDNDMPPVDESIAKTSEKSDTEEVVEELLEVACDKAVSDIEEGSISNIKDEKKPNLEDDQPKSEDKPKVEKKSVEFKEQITEEKVEIVDHKFTEEKVEIVDHKLEIIDESKEQLAEEKLVVVDQKMEIIEQKAETLEEMEIDVEPKAEESIVNDTMVEETITDQEENKENVELGVEPVKESTPEMEKSPEKESVASMSTDEQEESSSETSKMVTPSKTQGEYSGESTTPSTSPQSSKSSCLPRTPENDERLRQKERHLKTLGLLTHKAADEAIIAKQKRRKFLHNLSNNGSKKNANATSTGGSTTAGNAQNKSAQEYTGTLKTVIKLNRQSGGCGGGAGANEPKRGKNAEAGTKVAQSGNRRQSLKMTFQKGRGRPSNAEKSSDNPANTSGEDSYYTIQNEGEGATSGENPSNTMASAAHGRKSYNRSNTTDATHAEHHEPAASSKKGEKEEVVIPEKASSFKFHPGRLCQDQCYYCSGKFGLYDTPCHVGQIKSVERQQKILANEEKLTVDNCLCDACFRHVDRRANVPSYKKRLSMPGRIETAPATTSPEDTSSEQEKSEQPKPTQQLGHPTANTSSSHTCAVPECGEKAAHSLRRKGIRKSIKKSLLNFDMSTAGTYLHICEKHYEAVVQSSGCVLCKRRLGKNNMYHITTDTSRLEKALTDMGIPVTLGQGTAVCKLCRYFANLLMKPPEHGKVQKVEFVKNYRKRLLQFYNIHEKKDISHEEDDEGKSPSKKQNKPAGSKTPQKSLNTTEDEPMEIPSSPTHSTGSSVEVISDDGMPDNSPQKSATTAAETGASGSHQMVLDNDVMVDYDVPMISDSSSSASSSPSPQRAKQIKDKDQQSKLKAILQSVGTSLEDRNDISTALRSNPNISMRELFHGEEDLGLQFKAPFGGTSAQRTPEGWTRINTFLQYDEPTRRLWEDLQKPYGNQSSFLRHLILLEKYYRNGDLVLSSSASSNATVYTQTVRNRLISFDSRSSASSSSPSKEVEKESRSRSLSVDKIQRQLSSNSVTITARPKDSKAQPKESTESTKQKDEANATSTPNSRSILKTNLIKSNTVEIVPLSATNSTPNSTSNSPHSSSGSVTPSEPTLVLTKQQKILAAANKLMSNKQDTSPQKKTPLNTTPPELISLNRRPVQAQSQPMKRPQLLPKPMSGKPPPPNVIVLPDTLTTQERLESKSWRPTLLPVTTTSHHLNNQQGPLYQTADGRRLPALVQVQSGGRPFLISIHDYNRMCILRREKLMRDQMLKGSKGKVKVISSSTIFPPAAAVPSNKPTASTSTLQSFNKTMHHALTVANPKNERFIAKNSNFTPIAPKPPSTSTTSIPSTVTSQSQPTVVIPGATLQPVNVLSSTQILPNYSGAQPSPSTSTSASAVTGVPPNSSWLWNNFPDHHQMLMNGKAVAQKGPQQVAFNAMKQQQQQKQQQSLLLDNSLMSKIPKSLTVIPQHKLMPAPGASAGNMSKD